MTIEQSDKVDGMGVDAGNGEVVLIISDHLEWVDQAAHFSKLEQKLGGYINFVQSGQLEESVPQAKVMPTRIKLVHQYDPPVEAKSILNSIAQQLAEMNFRFSHESLPENY
jgi:hypothetical protein